MIQIEHSRTFSSQQFLQSSLTIDERQRPQVFSVQVQQIKRYEHALATTEQQVSKHGPTGIVNARNLPIKDSAFDFEVLRDPSGEIGETVKGIPIA